MSNQNELEIRIGKLEDALDHIARTVHNARHYTQRLAWIAERAESAIRGDDAWKNVVLPKSAFTELQRAKYRNRDLRVVIAEMADALNFLLSQTVDHDLAHGIELTEGEIEARQRAIRAIQMGEKPNGAHKLSSAAPELLEVLQEVQEFAGGWSQYEAPIGIHDRINAAIAKALGEESV
ncbi:hypothetical protein ACEK07_45940 [Alcanivoracaceae bacterium MT1]